MSILCDLDDSILFFFVFNKMSTLTTSWIVYVCIIVVFFLIAWFVSRSNKYKDSSFSFWVTFLIGSIIAAIVVFFMLYSIDVSNLSSSEKTWLYVLYYVAIIVPIVVLLILAFFRKPRSFQENQGVYNVEPVTTTSTIECDLKKNECLVKTETL